MDWDNYFEYKDGKLFWKVHRYARKVGTVAGSKHSGGYWQIWCNGTTVLAHRVIWEMHNGPIPSGMEIDHINRVKTDNQIENLRLVSSVVNHRNMPRNANNTSGTTGVIWDSHFGKWKAQIGVNGVMVTLGTFKHKEEAIQARKDAEAKYCFHENHGK